MGVETATFISQLSATNPLATDPISEGDDQIRLVKEVLQAQFTTLGAAAVTTTAAELNILDTVTATATELNYLDITTLGTSEASKVVTADANGDVTIADGAYDFDVASHDGTNGLLLGGTLVTATATELNLIDGYTGTTAELNYNDVTTLGTVEASKTVTASAAGLVNHADYVLSRPVIKDYAETVYAGGNTATAKTLDETNGNVQTWTMTGNCTFTMPSGSGLQAGTSMTLILTQDGTGSRTGAFTGVKWAGGTAPTLTTTATTGIDIITFYTFNGGASPVWYGFLSGAAMA
jgi:hypothetical protein